MNTIKIALLGIFTLIGVTGMSQKQNRDINHRLAKADSILIVKLELNNEIHPSSRRHWFEIIPRNSRSFKTTAPSL